mgnify:CR=1 FL=1
MLSPARQLIIRKGFSMETLDDILVRYVVVVRWLFLAGDRPPTHLDWVAAILVWLFSAIIGMLTVGTAALKAGLAR